jgi:acetylornithine deacetylase/succinyl-diaminopimelate desuccinylase-like protein
MLQRMSQRGQNIVMSLYMEAQNLAPVVSRNIIAEIPGVKYPEQVVMLGGHIDSWDVGQGAEDDGAGFMLSFQALSLIKQLNLQPLRTIRLIGWVCEEFGGALGSARSLAPSVRPSVPSFLTQHSLLLSLPSSLHSLLCLCRYC